MLLSNSETAHRSSENDDAAGESVVNYVYPPRSPKLLPRKGGGGHGGGHASGEGGHSGSAEGSPASEHGAPSAFTSSRSVTGFPIFKSGKTTTTATAYSNGGGKPFVLASNTLFSGRQAGGGTRGDVFGTSRFGSGYPYGGSGSYANSRPFPFIFFPVPPAHHYYGGDEYLNANETERPGGNLVVAIVQPSWNTSVTYRLLGDNNSVTAVFDALVANCSVVNSTSAFAAYSPSPDTWPLPEQIIRYYRASTFALSLDGYNNTAALPANMPPDNNTAPWPLSQDSPLPAGLNDTFLVCVNTTIGASVPLMDVGNPGFTARQVAEYVGFALLGFVGLLVCMCCCSGCCSDRKPRKISKY